MRLEESEAAKVIREAMGKVERCLGIGQGVSLRMRGRGRRVEEEGMNSGDLRGENAVSRGIDDGERGGTAGAASGQEVEQGVRLAPQGLPQATAATPHQS